MDPQMKLLFDELKSMTQSMEDLKKSVEDRINGVEHSLCDRFMAMESVAKGLEDWKPRVEASVEYLRVEVAALRKTVNRVVLEQSAPSPSIFPALGATAAISSAGNPVVGSDEHYVDPPHRETACGSVTAYTSLLVKGMYDSHSHKSFAVNVDPSGVRNTFELRSLAQKFMGRLPKMNFPQFDGDSPKLWISRSEDYFEMYSVEPSMWIKVASMHFIAASASWLQSVEKKTKTMSWPQFCRIILDRFGRDQHEVLIRQLFHIKQSGPISEYIEKNF
uniref:Retrotransposon gag domain-containing protein n=1 Tax=Arundo donax TaxID=35708 RepID=A0A0A9AK33_ARUDO